MLNIDLKGACDAIGKIDASKIKDYELCPRYFYLLHVLGWTLPNDNWDLVHGSAWESAITYFLSMPEGGLTDKIETAHSIFKKYIEENYDDEPQSGGKSIDNTRNALATYCTKFFDNPEFIFIQKESQKSIKIPIEDKFIYGLLDHYGENAYGKASIIDTKATKTERKYSLDENTRTYQSMIYSLWLNYNNDNVGYLAFRTTFFRTSNKWDGSEHIEVKVQKTPEQLKEFYLHLVEIVNEIEYKISKSLECPDMASSLFRKSWGQQACFSYFRKCQFYDFCDHCGTPRGKPLNFIEAFWDPEKGKQV